MAVEGLAEGWTTFLTRYRWDCFGTFTWLKPANYATLAVARAARFLRQTGRLQAAFLAAEENYLGGYHAHGLIAWRPDLVSEGPRHTAVWAAWRARWGSTARFETPKAGDAASRYVSKYLTKRVAEWLIVGDPVLRA